MPCIYHNNWAKSIVRKIFKFQYTYTNFKPAFKNTVVNMKNIKPAAVFRSITDSCFNVLLLVRFLSKILPRLENRFRAAHSSDKSEKINQDQSIKRKPMHIPAESSKGSETTLVAVAMSFERVNRVASFELPKKNGTSTNSSSERSTTKPSVSRD